MSKVDCQHLPSYMTPAALRKHFAQKKGPGGTLTDVKVSSSKLDGTSRRFAKTMSYCQWLPKNGVIKLLSTLRLLASMLPKYKHFLDISPDYS